MHIRSKTCTLILMLFSLVVLTSCELNPMDQPSEYSKEVIKKLKQEDILDQNDFMNYQSPLNYISALDDVTRFYEALTYTPLTENDIKGYDSALELPLRKALYIGLVSLNSIEGFDSQSIITREELSRLYNEALYFSGIEEYEELTKRIINTLENISNYNRIDDQANVEDSLFIFGSYFERYKRNYRNLLAEVDLDELSTYVIRVRVTYKNGSSKIVNATCFEKDQFISTYHDYKDAANIELIFKDGTIGRKNLCILDANYESDVIVFEYKDAPVKSAKVMANNDLKEGESVTMVYNKPDGTVRKGFGYAYFEMPSSCNLNLTGITGLNSSGGGLFNSEGELVGIITSELTDEGVLHKAVSIDALNVLHYDRESLDYFIKNRDTQPRQPNLIAITQDGVHYDLRWNNLDADYYKIYVSINDSSYFLLPSQTGEYKFYKGSNHTFTTVPNGRRVKFKAVAVKDDLVSEPYISEEKFSYETNMPTSYNEDLTNYPRLKIKNTQVDVSSIRIYEDGESETYPYIINYFISDLENYREITVFNPLIPNISMDYNAEYLYDVLYSNYQIYVTYYGIYSDYNVVEKLLKECADGTVVIYYNEVLEAYEVFIDLISGVSDQERCVKIN